MKYYSLIIDETGRDSLKDKPTRFNVIEEQFTTMDEVIEYLEERYGKVPRGRNKIYVDTDEGANEVGFIHSFWNRDISHNSKHWYQTDWISLYEVNKGNIKIERRVA